MLNETKQQECLEFANLIATAVVDALEKRGIMGGKFDNADSKKQRGDKSEKTIKTEKTAYAKTESLLYNYNNFKKIVEERLAEIESLQLYGIPQKSKSIVEYSQHTGVVSGLITEEESVEAAINAVESSIRGTVAALELIDKCMAALKNDPYYGILEMRYFEGRTQEDIALEFDCTQSNISYHRSRLIKELAMRIFPDQVAKEMLS